MGRPTLLHGSISLEAAAEQAAALHGNTTLAGDVAIDSR